MKKNTLFLMSMAAMFGLTSCDKELLTVENTDENNEENIIYASTEDGRTKTSLNGNDAEGYQVVWSEGDVFGYRISGKSYRRFILESGAGTTKGTFIVRGGMPDNTSDYTLFYPLEFTEEYWPVTQTYTKNNITGSPMYAELKAGFTADAHIQFKNVGGILRLTITGAKTDTIKSITVNAKNPDTSITLDCGNEGNGVALSPDGVQFHIAMPSADGIITADENDEVASYSDVYIQITDKSGKICTKNLKSGELVIKRSMITKASIPVKSSDFKTPSVGEKISFGAHEGIVVDLGGAYGTVIVATMNVGATSETDGDDCIGQGFTYTEAIGRIWPGWYLPREEFFTALLVLSSRSADGTKGAQYTNEDWGEMHYGVSCWEFGNNILYLPNNEVEAADYNKDCFNTIAKYRVNDVQGECVKSGIQIQDGEKYSSVDPTYCYDKDGKYLIRLFHELP